MSAVERYRMLYEYEKDCNRKMLAMIDSVPEAGRGDARFQQAVTLAHHLAACRQNWLDRIGGEGRDQVAWFDEMCDIATLHSRFAAIETRWTDFFASLDE